MLLVHRATLLTAAEILRIVDREEDSTKSSLALWTLAATLRGVAKALDDLADATVMLPDREL